MNREYLTVKIEKASHDCISLRTPSKFSKALLGILPFSVKSLLIGIDNEEDDTLFVLACSEDEYFAKLAQFIPLVPYLQPITIGCLFLF